MDQEITGDTVEVDDATWSVVELEERDAPGIKLALKLIWDKLNS